MDKHFVAQKLIEAEKLVQGFPESERQATKIAVLTTLLLGRPEEQPAKIAISPESGARKTTLQDFVMALNPATNSERIGVITAFAVLQEQKSFISGPEIKKSFALCGFRQPPEMCEAIRDARRKSGYLKSMGKDRFTLTPHGENLILDLRARRVRPVGRVSPV